jgi:outer membrane protein OmpA-like peptidoglycan-associated protein
LALLLGGALYFAAAPVLAQEAPGFAVNRLEPAERGSEWFVTDSLDLRGHGRPAMGFVLDYARRPLVFREDGGGSTALVSHQLFGHFGASVVFWDRLRLAGSLPVALSQSGQSLVIDGVPYTAPAGSAAGDLRLALDLRLLGDYRDVFSLAVGGRVWLPTGERQAYTGDDALRTGGHVLAAGEIGEFVYAGRLGVNYRSLNESFAGSPLGTELTFAASAGMRLLDDALVVGPELFGSTVLPDGGAFDKRTTPIDAIVGAHYTAGPWRVGAGVGPGLTRGMGSPAFRGLLSVEYIPPVAIDSDGDGFTDDKDACPHVAGVNSHDPARRGCPADGDDDGILDSQDACPREPGVADADPNRHGCPAVPADSDGDGIADSVDACPAERGRQHEDPQRNGCPPDADGDGIVDGLDACPAEKGVANADPAKNGCPAPPPDTDRDGIFDGDDACPDRAGSPSEDRSRHGCPQVVRSGDQLELLGKVQFALGSAEILQQSDELLRDVARVIKDLPETSKVRVEGHTDSVGRRDANQKLSQDRAQSVVSWLIGKGNVPASRLTAAGFGDTRPVAKNDTEEGRQLNRRVEFHVVDETDGPSSDSKGGQ